MYDLVRIHNPSGKPKSSHPKKRDLTFNVTTDEKLTIKPGEDQIVRFDVAAAVFGHPLIRNNGPKDRGRVDAYSQLRFYWGFHSGFDTETEAERKASPNAEYIGSWEAKMPPFRVETLDGDWVPMVLDDPEGVEELPGTSAVPTLSATEANVAILQAQLTAMATQQQQLIEMLTRSGGFDPAMLTVDPSGLADESTIPDAEPDSGAEDDEPTTVSSR